MTGQDVRGPIEWKHVWAVGTYLPLMPSSGVLDSQMSMGRDAQLVHDESGLTVIPLDFRVVCQASNPSLPYQVLCSATSPQFGNNTAWGRMHGQGLGNNEGRSCCNGHSSQKPLCMLMPTGATQHRGAQEITYGVDLARHLAFCCPIQGFCVLLFTVLVPPYRLTPS